ncbi:winged helix-turn-helix domain-containing protein [Arsukibacterium ikkense]|uniref:winged helix-turn-helix domain-containing protein n=1 Tax=Arsukibacterium ikkense TaxID=336831 RepID=UPI00069B1CEE|nr:winged helix-turn-helix domain-containing protein [Arsukibacterium ikkense]
MDETVTRLKLGDFVLDISQRILFQHGTEIAAEPKVIELLEYLCHQRHRYVSLQELHESVWPGRIVSDTAVRGTIKKLRLLLADEDINQPNYIKSISKRGYKLICPVSALSNEIWHTSSHLTSANPETGDTVATADNNIVTTSTKSVKAYALRPWIVLVSIGILIFIIYMWLSNTISEIPAPIKPPQLELLSGFPGEKHNITVSVDGRSIAFTGRTSVQMDNQIFLLDRATGSLRQLTHDATNALFLTFNHDDSKLIYSNYEPGNSSLHLIDLKNETQRTLITGQQMITTVNRGRTPSEILVAMIINGQSASMLYRLDLESASAERLLSVNSNDENVILAAYSPDKRLLATVIADNNKTYLQIIATENGKVQQQMSNQHALSKISWLTNSQLVLLDDNQLQLYDFYSNKRHQIISNQDGLIIDIEKGKPDELVLLEKTQPRANRYFSEYSLKDTATLNILDVSNQVTSMFYAADPKIKWITLLQQSQHVIARYEHNGRNTNELLTSYDSIEILDSAEDDSFLLLKVGNNLVVFWPEAQVLHYISNDRQVVSDGIINTNQRSILFGERVAGNWEIRQFDLSDFSLTTVLRGYRAVRQSSTGIFLADEQGALFWRPNFAALSKPLHQTISFAYINRWHAFGNQLLWTTFDYRYTYLHQLDVVSGEYSAEAKRFYEFYPRIAVKGEQEKVMTMSVKINNSKIQSLNLSVFK